MKKFLFLLVMFFATLQLFADGPEAIYGDYGLPLLSNIEEYQQFVGRNVIYLPKNLTSPGYYDSENFKGDFNKVYVISKITTKSPTRMEFILIDPTNPKAKPVKMFINTKDDYYKIIDKKKIFVISKDFCPPLFFIDKFNASKDEMVGYKYSDPMVNFNIEVIAVDLIKGENIDSYPTIGYTLRDNSNGKEYKVSASNADAKVKEIFSEAKSGHYRATLASVEKPSNPEIRYGETTKIDTENDIDKFMYEDNVISLVIFAKPSQFNFELKNISDNSLKIIWDEAVVVDFDGNTSKVMHSGTKYSARNESQTPTVIIKGAKIDDLAAPTDKVYYSEYLKEWRNGSMFPSKPYETGKKLTFMLPIQIKDVVNEYIFVFDLEYVLNHPELLK
jgi:hypothetical protein